MQIQTLNYTQLTIDQRAAVVALCSAAFDVDYALFLENMGPGVHLLGTVDGRLVAHALWVTRWLQPGPHPPLRTAYVEAVATASELRNRGYGTALMRHMAVAIQDYALGALATDEVGFYARIGWEIWQGPTFVRSEDGLLPADDPHVMILRLPGTPRLDTNWPLSCEWRPGEIW